MHLPSRWSFSRSRETMGRTQALTRTWPVVMDGVVAAIGLACFYAIVRIAHYWAGQAQPEISISLSPWALPLYAFYSLVRVGLAYVLSLIFAIGYGYVAAHSKRLEPLLVAGLDVCQSIPVLSFLPGVMLAMVALFPKRQVGVELGAILLIFTGRSVEHGVQLLLLSEEHSPRTERSCSYLRLLTLATAPPTGVAVWSDRVSLEFHGLSRRRLVLPDGLRNVCPGYT